MDGERLEVVDKAGGRGGVALVGELADERAQPALAVLLRGSLVERTPAGDPDPLALSLGQLGEDAPQAMDRAALTIGARPELLDRAHQAGRPVGNHEQQRAEAAAGERAAEAGPVLLGPRIPRQTSSSTRSPSLVIPQAKSTPSFAPEGRTGR